LTLKIKQGIPFSVMNCRLRSNKCWKKKRKEIREEREKLRAKQEKVRSTFNFKVLMGSGATLLVWSHLLVHASVIVISASKAPPTCDPTVGSRPNFYSLWLLFILFPKNRFLLAAVLYSTVQLLFKTKFLVELGVDLSFLEAKRHSEQD